MTFGQPACELHYPLSVLDRSPQLSHKITSRILQETCDRLIGSAKTSSGVAGETDVRSSLATEYLQTTRMKKACRKFAGSPKPSSAEMSSV